MQKRFDTITDSRGNVASATIRVLTYPGGGAATIYSDDGVTQVASATLSTDDDGYFEYYAANGRYTWEITTNEGVRYVNDVLHNDTLSSNQQFVAATGTGDAMVVAAFSAGYTLVDGDELRVRAPGANTLANPTIALPGVGTLTIYRQGGGALIAGDIVGSGHELSLRYRASPQRVELVADAAWVEASRVRTKQSGSASISRTVQDKGRDSVCVYEWLSAAQIADVEAGTLLVDCAAAIRACISDASGLRCTEIEFPGKGYLLASQAVANTSLANGMRFKATGKRDGLDSADGVVFKYTGTAICWDIRQANGTASNGNLEWEGFTFQCSDGAGGMFSLNFTNQAGSAYTPTDDGTTPSYLRDIRFKNCKAWGANAGALQTGDFIQACKAFEIITDENFECRGWRRGLYLKGCDNYDIKGRISSNTRNIHVEASGNFGNGGKIDARFLGTTVAGSETRYLLYLAANVGPVVIAPFLEDSGPQAAIYLGGVRALILHPYFSVGATDVMLELGAGCIENEIIAPRYPSSGAKVTTSALVAAPTSWDFGANKFYGVTIKDADRGFVAAYTATGADPNPRIRLVNSLDAMSKEFAQGDSGLWHKAAGIPKPRARVLTPYNYTGASFGFGVTAPSIVADTNGFNGYAVKLDKVNNSGFSWRIGTCGINFENGDIILFRIRSRHDGTPAAGTYRYSIQKNGANISNAALAASLAAQPAYATDTVAYTVSTFAAGNFLEIKIFNSAVTDVYLYVAEISANQVDTAIADTSSGVVATVEAELNKVKAALRNHNLIAP